MERTDFNTPAYFEIETLSPLHVGSGDSLRRDFDYLEFSGDRDEPKTIALMDHERILELIGPARVGEWVRHIDTGGSTMAFLRRFHKEFLPEDVGARLISYREQEEMVEFKPMITDAQGHPYLPGSSLKGAIRTALLAEGLRRNGKVSRELKLDGWKRDQVGKFFGTDMNLDLLRFLMPSDALFSKTRCLPVDILNKTHKGWQFKQQRDPLFLEVIPKNQIGHTRILFPHRLWEVLRLPQYAGHGIQTGRAYGLGNLLSLLHTHNMRLLNREINFWVQTERGPAEAGDYVNYLQSIATRASAFDPQQEALIRVGFATGFTSITGGWQEYCMGYSDFDSLMEGRQRGELPYPKTRKLAKGYIPFGYLRLRLVQEDKRLFPKPVERVSPPKEAVMDPTPVDPPVTDPEPPITHIGYTQDRLRKGLELIGEYSPQSRDQGALKTFKLLIQAPGSEQFVQLRYPADLIPGQRYKVRITNLDPRSSQVKAIEFRGTA